MFHNCLRVLTACTLLLVLPNQALLAQDPAAKPAGVNGRVLDDYARPMPGVVVAVKGTTLRDTTGIDGSFELNTAAPATVLFSHPLYETREKKISSFAEFTLRMTETYLRVTNGADTAVLVNKTQRRTDLLYESKPSDNIISSVSTVYGNQLRTTPSSLYLSALQGRLAGLNINQYSGFYSANTSPQIDVDIFVGNIPKNNSGSGPSDNTEFAVQLRGHAGSNGQAPIVIIDGVQREIYSIDPQNIESVSILKDALATILVGQNSSRGVLLVTTKNPTLGAPHLSFTAEVGSQSALGMPNPLSAYQHSYLVNEALLNEGRSAAYSAEDLEAWRTGSDPMGHPDVNWYNTILRDNALMSRYNLNVQGGGTRARYIVSLSYLNQDGLFRSDPANSYNTNLELKRYLLNSKVDIDVNDRFNIALQLFGRLQQGNQPGAQTSAIMQALLRTPNNAYPAVNPNGSYGGNSNYRTNLLSMVQNSGYINDNSNDVMANLDLNYKLDRFLPGLYFRGRGNVSVQSSSLINRSKVAPVYNMVVAPSGDTSYNLFGSPVNQVNMFTSTSWARYTFAQLSLGYDKKIGDHSIQSMVLFDQKTTLLNYDIPGKLTNIAGKASYDFKGKYMAEAALNYSGYNRYKPGNQFGFFYAGGLGWNVAKENFIADNISWINLLKLRATFGRTGNANIDNYGYYIYRSYFQDVAGTYPIGNGYPGGGGLAEGGGSGNQTLANVNATWEKAYKFDAGADLSLFNNKIQFTADYYYERYYDMLQERGKSIELIGARYIPENIGINRFSGWEFTGTYQSHFRDFNFFVTGNASIQQSRVLFIDEQFQPNDWNKRTGKRVGQPFGLISDGIIQSNEELLNTPTITGYTLHVGDYKYRDLNNDGVIDQFDVAPIGKQKPLITFGLNMGFSFKGFAVSALIQGVTNRDIYTSDDYLYRGFIGQNNGFSQAYDRILGRWIPELGTAATSPRLTPGGNAYNYSPLGFGANSALLHDGNYFRLKNVSVEYNLPYQVIRSLKLSGVKLFFTAQNLATWAAYDVQDPEVAMPSYPVQRVVNFGINIKI
ncbi:MAG: SusC/RagA family TonB-linked outer membrane protein [Chitinophagaceae bacterium]|nr:MAG: SusC/RagA family TonB-linked outer membrane protein [Chitinophagaceae bacterium]